MDEPIAVGPRATSRSPQEREDPTLLRAMTDGSALGAVGPVEIVETHLSRVFLAGQRAYKLKKPVVLPFADYGSAARRREMCRLEVALNRRLAPSVYLGTAALLRGPDGSWRLGADGDPGAAEHVVVMRRFDAGDTLAAAVEAGRGGARLAEVATVLARFHAAAEAVRAPGVVAAWRGTLLANLSEIAALAPALSPRLVALERFTRAFLDGRGRVLERRRDEGLMRDGHGDLRADHILLEDAVSVVDCVEFDPALRRIDVSADLAYLVADLEVRGAPALGRRLAGAYREAGGDPGDERLLAFFCAYRALVGAKVALHRGADPAGSELAARLEAAERFAWRARLGPVAVVCGPSGAGKSALASELGRLACLPVVGSDRTRKEMLGVKASTPAPAAAYAEPVSRRVYARMGELARERVSSRGGVIADATFARETSRAAFGSTLGLPAAEVLHLRCVLPETVARERVRKRAACPGAVSDADEAVLERQLASWQAFGRADRVVDVDAAGSPASTVEAAAAALDADMAGAGDPPSGN